MFDTEDRYGLGRSRNLTDSPPYAFKAEHGAKTTPQILISGERVGGYDDLRRLLGKAIADPKAVTYKPIIAVFSVTALMALATSYAAMGNPLTICAGECSLPSACACWRP